MKSATLQQKYDLLTDQIRAGADLAYLRRLVGPSEEQLKQSEARLKRMDQLSPACNWDEAYPGSEAAHARDLYRYVEQLQAKFENSYL